MSHSTPGEKFEFLIVTLKVQSLNPRVLAHVWVSVWYAGDRVCGCMGVLVTGRFFFCSYSFAFPSKKSHAIHIGHRDPFAAARRDVRVVGKHTSEMEESCNLATDELMAICAVRGGAPLDVWRGTNVAEESEESCL